MGSQHPAVHAVEQHAARWNAQDRAAWLELFADDVVFEDPVGKAPKLGRVAAEGSWHNSFTEGRVWTLHPQRIIAGANEASPSRQPCCRVYPGWVPSVVSRCAADGSAFRY